MRKIHIIARRAAALAAATLALSVASAAAAGAAGSHGRTGPGVHYALIQRLCPAVPAPGEWTCFGEKRVPVPKGTPGARAYAAPDFTQGPNGGYTPGDLATAYNYDPAIGGTGQIVAVVDAHNDPNALSDLNMFDTQYGITNESLGTTFRQVNQHGQTSPLPSFDPGWAGEIALDIEAVRGACHACTILLVEADSASSSDLAAAAARAAKMGATEISNSYGGPESTSHDSAGLRAAYDHPGVVVTASTGDDGWFSWDRANHLSAPVGASANSANTPSTYPTVIAVTGTKLTLNTDDTHATEKVWNENGKDNQAGFANGDSQGASGGGCSLRYAAPAWQANVANYAHTGCGTKRLAGDVAALADPETGFDIYDSSSGGTWVTVGGTSLSSPIIAAMYALAGGAGGVDYPARTLYDRFKHTPSSRYDVTSGGNAFCDGDSATHCSHFLHSNGLGTNPNSLTNGNTIYPHHWAGELDCLYKRKIGTTGTDGHTTECDAASGYDGPSGVGAPAGLTLFIPRHASAALIGPALIRVGHSASFSATFGDLTGGAATAVSYHFKWGDGHTTNTSHAFASHTFHAKGTYHVSLTVTDSNSNTTAPSTRTYTIGIKPSVSIVGPTHFKAGTQHNWSAKVKEVNTGGAITHYSWKVDGQSIQNSNVPGISGRIGQTGTHHLSVTVTDNSGLKATKTEKLTVTHA
jgi:hypothetical protein